MTSIGATYIGKTSVKFQTIDRWLQKLGFMPEELLREDEEPRVFYVKRKEDIVVRRPYDCQGNSMDYFVEMSPDVSRETRKKLSIALHLKME